LRLVGVALAIAGCALVGGSTPVDVTFGTAPGENPAFVPAGMSVPAGKVVRLTFRNESAVAHNLVFTTGVTAGTNAIVDPGTSETLSIGPLVDGVYRFVCTIHEEMTGELAVGSAARRTDSTPTG
jgi:plastocyanin